MGKPAGTHQPLRWYDKLRLNAAKKHLHSKFHSVRQAALKEIQAILAKKRGLQNRLREWLRSARNAAVRKVTPSQLHKPLRVQKQAPQQARGRTADIPLASLRRRGFVPPHGFNQTKEQLRERARGGTQPAERGHADTVRELQADRQQRQQAYRNHEASELRRLTEENNRLLRQQRDRERQRTQPGAMQQAQPQGAQARRTEINRQFDAERDRQLSQARDDVRRSTLRPVPPLPGHPEAVHKAAEDHEKGRWAGLRKRTGDGPGRTRTGRSRTRNPA